MRGSGGRDPRWDRTRAAAKRGRNWWHQAVLLGIIIASYLGQASIQGRYDKRRSYEKKNSVHVWIKVTTGAFSSRFLKLLSYRVFRSK